MAPKTKYTSTPKKKKTTPKKKKRQARPRPKAKVLEPETAVEEVESSIPEGPPQGSKNRQSNKMNINVTALVHAAAAAAGVPGANGSSEEDELLPIGNYNLCTVTCF